MGKTILAFLLLLTLSLSGVAVATDDKKITICHHTGSQSNPTVTITVSENAWEAHQKHGDTKGPCPDATASPKATATATAKPTETPKATKTATPTTPVVPTATATAKATPTANVTATATAKPAVKQLPSTSTERSQVPYDPGFGE